MPALVLCMPSIRSLSILFLDAGEGSHSPPPAAAADSVQSEAEGTSPIPSFRSLSIRTLDASDRAWKEPFPHWGEGKHPF